MVTKATGVEEFPAGDCENGETRGPTWNPEKQQHLKSLQGQGGSLRGQDRAIARNEEKLGADSGHGVKGKPF